MPVEHFLLGGAQRSGTTHLYHLLDQHPEIAMARPLRPEPKYFLGDNVNLRDYHALFPEKEGAHVFVEKSTSYMERIDAAPAIRSILGNPRMVFLLRDPVERALSNYRFSVEHGAESAPLKEALFNEDARRDNYDRSRFSVSPFAYVRRGNYVDFIQQWADAIGRNRIHLVVLERLNTDPLELQTLFRRLGVRESFQPAIPERPHNRSTFVIDVDPEVRRELAARFEDSNRRLHEQYGVDISLWQAPQTAAANR